MDFKERLEKIKNYFISQTIADGAICFIVKFPKTWTIGEPKSLREEFLCEVVAQQDNCFFFVTEIENGFDTVFDCIDYVVTTNKAIEEKSELLQIKAKELTELFVKEPLEKLKTMYFAFEEPTENTKKKGKKKQKVTNDTVAEDKPLMAVKEPESYIEEATEEPVETINEVKEEKTSGLLAFAEKLVRE